MLDSVKNCDSGLYDNLRGKSALDADVLCCIVQTTYLESVRVEDTLIVINII